ncbi:transposase [Streptomyces zaomyceticus]|uniref:transposase n=1 Tax=Streptomyces zaomyceticus TaxID=68286 RepID=UPI0036B1673F
MGTRRRGEQAIHQPCGQVTDCQAGVSQHLASSGASAAVNWRLFLPENWDPAQKADPGK